MSLTTQSHTRVTHHATTSLSFLYVRFNADISWNHRDIISVIELVIFQNLNQGFPHAFLLFLWIPRYILAAFGINFFRLLLIDLGHISFCCKVNLSVGYVSVYFRNNSLKVELFVLRVSRLQTHTHTRVLHSYRQSCHFLRP